MTPDKIRQTREEAGISVAQAARLVYVSERNWRRWESGDRQMPAAAWELFQTGASWVPVLVDARRCVGIVPDQNR